MRVDGEMSSCTKWSRRVGIIAEPLFRSSIFKPPITEWNQKILGSRNRCNGRIPRLSHYASSGADAKEAQSEASEKVDPT